MEDEYFNKLYNQVHSLNKKQYERLENFLGDMEESTPIGGRTIEQYKSYIKSHRSNNKILFITFKIRDIRKLAHICKYILELEWNNEWALGVAGQHTRTIFGWFD